MRNKSIYCGEYQQLVYASDSDFLTVQWETKAITCSN